MFERLDRAISNQEWRVCFPDASVYHLTRIQSDHRPLLIKLQSFTLGPLSRRPFKFQAAWISNNEFSSFMLRAWDRNHTTLMETLSNLSCRLRAWNRDVFGNIFQQKKKTACANRWHPEIS